MIERGHTSGHRHLRVGGADVSVQHFPDGTWIVGVYPEGVEANIRQQWRCADEPTPMAIATMVRCAQDTARRERELDDRADDGWIDDGGR